MSILNKNLHWGFISQFLSTGVNLLILPFVVYYLSSEEIGIWYNFSMLYALVLLLDFGISTTLTRNVAYAWAGCKAITSERLISRTATSANSVLLGQVFHASRKIYYYITLVAFFILSTIASYYIYKISSDADNQSDILISWIVYCFAMICNLYYFYWTPMLRGIGAVEVYYKSNCISKFIQFSLTILGLYFGFGLLAVSIAYLVSVVINRIYSKISFMRFISCSSVDLCLTSVDNKAVKEILINSKKSIFKQGVISISNYMSDKVALVFVTVFLGLEASGSFGITVQALTVVSVIANVFYNTVAPKIIHSKVQGDSDTAYELLFRSLSYQVLIIVVFGIAAIFVGPYLLILFNSNTSFVDTYSMLIMLMYVLVFNYQLVNSNFIIMDNEFPMLIPYVITAISFCALAYISLMYISNIFTLVLIQLLCQLSYNAWKWPSYVSKGYKSDLLVFFKKTLVSW